MKNVALIYFSFTKLLQCVIYVLFAHTMLIFVQEHRVMSWALEWHKTNCDLIMNMRQFYWVGSFYRRYILQVLQVKGCNVKLEKIEVQCKVKCCSAVKWVWCGGSSQLTSSPSFIQSKCNLWNFLRTLWTHENLWKCMEPVKQNIKLSWCNIYPVYY